MPHLRSPFGMDYLSHILQPILPLLSNNLPPAIVSLLIPEPIALSLRARESRLVRQSFLLDALNLLVATQSPIVPNVVTGGIHFTSFENENKHAPVTPGPGDSFHYLDVPTTLLDMLGQSDRPGSPPLSDQSQSRMPASMLEMAEPALSSSEPELEPEPTFEPEASPESAREPQPQLQPEPAPVMSPQVGFSGQVPQSTRMPRYSYNRNNCRAMSLGRDLAASSQCASSASYRHWSRHIPTRADTIATTKANRHCSRSQSCGPNVRHCSSSTFHAGRHVRRVRAIRHVVRIEDVRDNLDGASSFFQNIDRQVSFQQQHQVQQNTESKKYQKPRRSATPFNPIRINIYTDTDDDDGDGDEDDNHKVTDDNENETGGTDPDDINIDNETIKNTNSNAGRINQPLTSTHHVGKVASRKSGCVCFGSSRNSSRSRSRSCDPSAKARRSVRFARGNVSRCGSISSSSHRVHLRVRRTPTPFIFRHNLPVDDDSDDECTADTGEDRDMVGNTDGNIIDGAAGTEVMQEVTHRNRGTKGCHAPTPFARRHVPETDNEESLDGGYIKDLDGDMEDVPTEAALTGCTDDDTSVKVGNEDQRRAKSDDPYCTNDSGTDEDDIENDLGNKKISRRRRERCIRRQRSASPMEVNGMLRRPSLFERLSIRERPGNNEDAMMTIEEGEQGSDEMYASGRCE